MHLYRNVLLKAFIHGTAFFYKIKSHS